MALRTEEVRALIECVQNLAPCAVALTHFRERNPSDLAVGRLSLAELDWRVSSTVALLHRLLENAELNELEIAEQLLDMVNYTHRNIPKLQAAARLAYLALDQVRETPDQSAEGTIRMSRRICEVKGHER
jgi:hypothetical protein